MIVVVDEREVDFDTLVHRWIGKTFGDTITIGHVGDVFTDGRQIILAVGILHVRQQFTRLCARCVRRLSRSRVARIAAG
jgi:hypothetical protein